MPPSTMADALHAALDAYDELTELGEDVEDEWSYIQDLTGAWRARLDDVRAVRGDDALDPAVVTALETVAAEIRSVEDPHRAIDWLSTFPQVVLLAIGERP